MEKNYYFPKPDKKSELFGLIVPVLIFVVAVVSEFILDYVDEENILLTFLQLILAIIIKILLVWLGICVVLYLARYFGSIYFKKYPDEAHEMVTNLCSVRFIPEYILLDYHGEEKKIHKKYIQSIHVAKPLVFKNPFVTMESLTHKLNGYIYEITLVDLHGNYKSIYFQERFTKPITSKIYDVIEMEIEKNDKSEELEHFLGISPVSSNFE